MKKTAKVIFLVVFNIFLTLAILEGCVELSLIFPKIVPEGSYKTWLRGYYINYDRTLMHFDPTCSMASQKLGYQGRPNCTYDFKTREFDTLVTLNSKGTRDPESSLDKPEILVLGDSQAFGWGVEREQSFPGLLEKWTGRKVLTVAFPSYGTAREVIKLFEFDLSHIKWVIVQYHENDRNENFAFVSNWYNLNVMTKKFFSKAVKKSKQNCRYWPGKHVYHVFKAIIESYNASSSPGKHSEEEFFSPGMEANMFTAILLWSEVRKLNAPVWVVQLSAWGKNNDDFHDALVTEIGKIKEKHKLFQRVMPVSVASELSAREDYFGLDDHLNAAGQKKVAEILLEKMKKESPDIIRR